MSTSTIIGLRARLTTIKSFLALMNSKKSIWESTAFPSKSSSYILSIDFIVAIYLTKLFFATNLLIRCMCSKFWKLSNLLFEISSVVTFLSPFATLSGTTLIKLWLMFNISILLGNFHKFWILLKLKLRFFRKLRELSSFTSSVKRFPLKSSSLRFLNKDNSGSFVTRLFTNLNVSNF